MVIESKQNARFKHVRKLMEQKKYRAQCGQFVAEGEKMLEEAIRSGATLEEIFVSEQAQASAVVAQAQSSGVAIHIISGTLMRALSDLETPQSLLFTCRMRAHAGSLSNVRNMLVLDALQDPGNLGTILRTADAFALDAVVLCEGCVDAYAPKVVRATMGAIFRLALLRMSLKACIISCNTQDIAVYATALSEQSVPIREVDFARACAVIIGNEGNGVSEYGMQCARQHIKIPMAGSAESLNAAVAASIVIYEMMR